MTHPHESRRRDKPQERSHVSNSGDVSAGERKFVAQLEADIESPHVADSSGIRLIGVAPA